MHLEKATYNLCAKIDMAVGNDSRLCGLYELTIVTLRDYRSREAGLDHRETSESLLSRERVYRLRWSKIDLSVPFRRTGTEKKETCWIQHIDTREWCAKFAPLKWQNMCQSLNEIMYNTTKKKEKKNTYISRLEPVRACNVLKHISLIKKFP